MATGFLLLLTPWQVRSMLLGGNSYFKQVVSVNPYQPEWGMMGIGDGLTRFFSNLRRYITKEIPSACFPFIEIDYSAKEVAFSAWILGFVIFILTVGGLWNIKKNSIFIASYLLITLGILMLWPSVWFGIRFFLPLIPLVVFYMIVGLTELIRWGSRKLSFTKEGYNNKKHIQFLSYTLILSLLAFNLPKLKELHQNAQASYSKNYENYFALAKWAQYNTPKNTVFCCRKPGLFYLFANRYVTNCKNIADTEAFINDLKEKRVDYVVLDQLGYSSTVRYLYPAIQAFPEKFQLAMFVKDPDTYLLRLKR